MKQMRLRSSRLDKRDAPQNTRRHGPPICPAHDDTILVLPNSLFVLIQFRVTRCPYHVNAISSYQEPGLVWKKAPLFASLMFCLTTFAFGADLGEAGGQRKL